MCLVGVGKRMWDSCGLESPEASLLFRRGICLGRTLLSTCSVLHLIVELYSWVVWWKCKKLVEIFLHNYALFHNIKSTFNQGLWRIIQRIFLKPIVLAVCSERKYACSIVFFFQELALKKTKTPSSNWKLVEQRQKGFFKVCSLQYLQNLDSRWSAGGLRLCMLW